MSAGLRVDLASPVPPFEQIRAGVTALVAAGDLAPGARLPTVRSLAADLGVAAGTVARAYRELEATGVIESHGRRGTAVRASAVVGRPAGAPGAPGGHDAPGARVPHEDAALAANGGGVPGLRVSAGLADAVEKVVEAARAEGVPADAVAALVRRAYRDPLPDPLPDPLTSGSRPSTDVSS